MTFAWSLVMTFLGVEAALNRYAEVSQGGARTTLSNSQRGSKRLFFAQFTAVIFHQALIGAIRTWVGDFWCAQFVFAFLHNFGEKCLSGLESVCFQLKRPVGV
jgi:hypothetical protein